MSGLIHFVTPTNRWMGSIPLSTIDPLTLEPLSTYLRSDTHEAPTNPLQEGNETHNIHEQEENKERTTNIAGQPVSLILARLQTTPQGCSCGCTVPAPPKHSDYYHAQHVLRLMFQTQKVRSRALKANLPQYFERQEQEQDTDSDLDLERDSDTFRNESELQQHQQQHWQHPSAHTEAHSVVIPMEEPSQRQPRAVDGHFARQRTHSRHQRPTDPRTIKKRKSSRYVHSLVQNRALRNPLTNMDIEGDPTFFVVLEPGQGGWWHEPLAMTPQPIGIQSVPHRPHSYNHHQNHHQQQQQEDVPIPQSLSEEGKTQEEEPAEKTLDAIQYEKELRKEKWRQGRAANLEVEAQHELDWRRWKRSLECASKGNPGSRTRSMRFKLGRDVALLESSENGLRLPRHIASNREEGEEGKEEYNCSLVDRRSVDVGSVKAGQDTNRSAQASNKLNETELNDIHQHQVHSSPQHPQSQAKSAVSFRKPEQQDAKRSRLHRPPPEVLPWWDPDPQPFKMPSTKLSPFAISTLPEPVAKAFGGKSLYACAPFSPQKSPQTDPNQEQPQILTPEKEPAEGQEHESKKSQEKEAEGQETEQEDPEPKPAEAPINSNTNGCRWVSVQRGDRIAVMIGTSRDFLLFPSFQRLLFRHLSREDFEDRVGRVGVIPNPISTIVMEGRRAQDGGRRRGGRVNRGTSNQRSQRTTEDPEAASRSSETSPSTIDAQQRERSEYGQRARQTRSWISWISRRAMPSSNSGAHITVAPTAAEARDSQDSQSRYSAGCSSEVHDLDSQSHLNDEKALDEQTDSGSLKRQAIDPFSQKISLEKAGDDIKRQWAFYRERHEREDYDSSDYLYSSSDDDDESNVVLHPDDFSDSDSSSGSSEEDGQSTGGRDNASAPRRCCGGMRDWICLLLCCRRSPALGRSATESRRERRRRLRRERWRLHRLQQQQQESEAMYRYLPGPVRRMMGPEEMHRCCQMAEFCRFYLTIMIAIALMGAIVYGAVQAEASPSASMARKGRPGQSGPSQGGDGCGALSRSLPMFVLPGAATVTVGSGSGSSPGLEPGWGARRGSSERQRQQAVGFTDRVEQNSGAEI
ncbi:hypothetical protein BGZ58_009794 [Dissophora ornata]|nr:hypothetical protein BGZ58_009794 [Dissophora ornata]